MFLQWPFSKIVCEISSINMVLMNGGYLHCTDIKKFLKYFSESDKKKLARVISKIQMSDPGPYWPSCFTIFSKPFFPRLVEIVIVCKPLPKQALVFTCPHNKSFDKNVGRGEVACNEQFLLSHSVFYPFGELCAIFVKFEIVVFKLFQFGRV